MHARSLTGCTAALLLLVASTGVADAQPWSFPTARHAEISGAFVTDDSGMTRESVVELRVTSGLMLDHRLGVGLEIPVFHTAGTTQEQGIGNPSLTIYWNLWRRYDRRTDRAWLYTSASTAVLQRALENDLGATVLANYWVRDPALYAPDTEALRIGGAYEVHQRTTLAGADVRIDYWHADDDIVRLFARAHGAVTWLSRLRATAAAEAAYLVNPPSGLDRASYAVELAFGVIGDAGGRLELYTYVPFRQQFQDPFSRVGGGLRAAGTF